MKQSILKNPFVVFLRWILFLPFEIIVLGLITNGVFIFMAWLIHLGIGWFIAFLIFGSFLYSLIGMLIFGIAALMVNFCPNVKVGVVSVLLIATSSGVYSIINIWKCVEDFSSISVFFAIAFTIIHLYLFWYIFIGTTTQLSDDF